jgi:hypothetical protein
MGGTCRQSVCYGEEKTLVLPGTDDQFLGCPALNPSIGNIPALSALVILHFFLEYFKNT